MIRVIRALWRTSLAEELQYRANFIASVLGTVFWIGTSMLTLAVFFRQTETLGGWEFWEVVVLLGVYNALGGLVESMIRPGLGQLVSDVRNGALDLVLAKPVETQVYVSFRKIDIWRLSDVLLGLGLAVFALVRLDGAPSIVQILSFVVAFVSAAIVLYALWIALMSTAFWFVAVENVSVLFDAVFEGARYPMSAYPGVLRFLFVYLIPVALTTSIPAGALTGRFSPVVAWLGVAAAGLALLLTRMLWRIALRKYTSAGG
jgi:ABC-2 type transport system permease protein